VRLRWPTKATQEIARLAAYARLRDDGMLLVDGGRGSWGFFDADSEAASFNIESRNFLAVSRDWRRAGD
jgi:hypothetical protein